MFATMHSKLPIFVLLVICLAVPARGQWVFVDVTVEAGLSYVHGYDGPITSERWFMAGGAAAGDVNRDGWPDIYAVHGETGANLLFLNQRNGSFLDIADSAGVAVGPEMSCGPILVDLNGDRWLDLVVGGVVGDPTRVFRNGANGRFTEISDLAGLDEGNNDYSFAFGDYDRDGDLDAAVAHWNATNRNRGDDDDFRLVSLWRSEGDGTFSDVSIEAGILEPVNLPWSFTPNFADITNDGWPDLLVAGDFGTSVVYVNQRDGTFLWRPDPVINDENGMGAAVGDYDADGDLDWFVSSIWDEDGVAEANWGITGNRLYRNTGDGTFEDATDEAGVRHGYWGWGSCFADFNNDGYLDLFHVNGFPGEAADQFHEDPARMFINRGDGTFEQRSEELGVANTGQGRGILCFDYDLDGDIDLFVTNNAQASVLYRNDGGNDGSFLVFTLEGNPPNTSGIGGRVFARVGTRTQMIEIRAGNNFVSSDPSVAHFGFGAAQIVDEVKVVWPDGTEMIFLDVAVNQFLTVTEATGEVRAFDPTARPSRRRAVRR